MAQQDRNHKEMKKKKNNQKTTQKNLKTQALSPLCQPCIYSILTPSGHHYQQGVEVACCAHHQPYQ